MLQLEVLVRKGFGAINAGTASAITIEEVSTLDHKFFDLRPIRFCDAQHSADERIGKFGRTTRWNLLPL